LVDRLRSTAELIASMADEYMDCFHEGSKLS
jgi:hypothetical protein